MGRDRQRRRGVPALPDAARPAGKVPRRLRVEREVMVELAAALRTLRDPRLQHVGVTRVELTGDLRFARVYVRNSYGAADEAEQTAIMRAAEAASGRLRRHVGQALALRYAPELRFMYDAGPDAAHRVEELLSEIQADAATPDEEVGCDDEEAGTDEDRR